MDKSPPRRPTPAEVAAAFGRTVPDLIRPGLKALFVGINPSLYSAVVCHHFARPGNRFWPTLHAAGITPRRFEAREGRELLALGYGITNVADRATATAEEVPSEDFIEGAKVLARKVRRYRPASVAFLGITAYRAAFGRPGATVGRQVETLEDAAVWVLPNPSGLNAHYQLADLARLYRQVKEFADGDDPAVSRSDGPDDGGAQD